MHTFIPIKDNLSLKALSRCMCVCILQFLAFAFVAYLLFGSPRDEHLARNSGSNLRPASQLFVS